MKKIQNLGFKSFLITPKAVYSNQSQTTLYDQLLAFLSQR
ncbi:hypothetical protein CZ794_03940 [Psychrobacter sp. JB385]|nr:hypothetical protein CZ794_03940 [Psychrobacter sp. JB385]